MPAELLGLFRPSAQHFVISLLRLDPARMLASLRIPALVIGGGTDIQVGRADFDALATARPGIETRWFAAMNHVLTDAPADRAGNIATYAEPGRPLSDGLAEVIADFVGGVTRR